MIGKTKNIRRSGTRPKGRDALLGYTEDLQAQGRLVFTSDEACAALSVSGNAFVKAAVRLIRKSKLLKQWWRPKTRVKKLMKFGMYHSQARIYGQKGRHWFLANTKFMNAIFSRRFWDSRGLVSLSAILTKARQGVQTAGYGTVRPVV